MKHFTQATANGLHTPPCGSSHGKSTRFFFLTLLLGLLTLGSTSAWGADYYIAHGDGWNTNNNWGFNEGMTKVGDVYYYKLAGRAQNSKIQFKIRPSDDDSGWNKHLYQNANADTQNRGNITLLGEQEGSDTKKRFAYTPTTSGGEDIYIYTDGSQVWANAVTTGASLSGKTIRLQGDLWTGTDDYGWSIGTQSPTLEVASTGEYASTAFYIPVPTTEGADKYVQARFEIVVNGAKDSNLGISVNGATNASTDKAKTIAKIQGNQSSRVKYVQVRYYANHQAITTISDAPTMTGNWYLYIDKVLKGQFVNGQLIVDNLPADKDGGYHSIYVAQRDDLANVGKEIKTSYPQGIEWLGGLYIDTDHSSSDITWSKGYYGDNAKFTNLSTFPLINGTTSGQSNSPSNDEKKKRLDARGGFKLPSAGNTLFSLNNGVLTIKKQGDYTAPEPDPTPSGVTFTGDEYIFWKSNISSWGTFLAGKDRTQFLQFKNSYTNQTAHTNLAFLWEQTGSEGDNFIGILAAIAPQGTWDKVRHCRVNADSWNEGAILGTGEGSTDWIDLQPGNYIHKDNGSITFATKTEEHFKFYLAGSVALAGGSGEFNPWNGNGTLHTDAVTKTLNAANEYKFKLNPDMRIYDNRGGVNKWTNEFNWTDVDAANSSNAINLRNGGNNEIWFDLSRKSDVTIACDGHHVTVNAVPYYLVTFKDGESTLSSVEVKNGEKASAPSDPEKANYTFNYWKLEGGSTAFDFVNTTITSDITLVADWTAPTLYTVRFMDGETELTELAQNVAEGAYASEPDPAPTKSGYSSVKWQLNGVDYNFSNPVTGNITLDAVWDAKTLTGISLDQTNIVMVLGGDAVTLTPSYAPADLIPAQQPIYEWSVAPAGVVEVSNAGVVSVVAEGSATITCTAQGTDKSADCVVTVKDCNTVPTDIFSYTLGSDPTGIAAGSAVMNGMFNEASNAVEPTLQQVNIQLSAETNDHKWIYDNGDETRNVKIDNETDDNKVNDAFKWYVIEVSEGVMALQNVNTKHYLAMSDEVEDNGNVWGRKFATTIESYITNVGLNNDALWKWGSCDENSPRLKVMSTAQNNANYTTGEYTLHCYGMSNNWRPDNTVMVGSQDGCQGNKHLRPFFKNAATVPNPAYLKSPDAGYYRFATGASVVATLNRAIKVNDVIRLEVKNPSEAAVSATVTIGSQVANINLAAGATSTETITVTDGSRPTSITIASDNVNFMLKSVAVNREMPNPAKNPNLAWSGTPSAARQVADGDISSYIATRLGTGLITYTSSDESIATVAANGTVHPIAEGTVTITATLEQDGCYDGGSINYSLTLVDLPKPTITITANDEMPQGSYQTVTVAQNGDGALTFEITSGTGATLTDNGNGTYRLALAGNATDIVLTASTERTGQHAQHSVSKNISVQQCYVDGHVIYEYELTGHADATDVVATGGTYSQANLASVGTTDNPATVTKIKLKFSKGNGNRIYAVDNGGNLRVQDVGNVDIAEWLLIPAGETVSNPFGTNASYPVYYVCNAKTGRYIYYGSTTSGSGDWVYTIAQLSSTNYKTNYYKWFIEVNNGETRIFSVQNRTNERKSSFKLNSANQYDSGYGSDVKNDHSLLCVGKMSDTNEYSRIYTDNGEMNVGSAANPDYFYSVENDNHTYYILNGGTVTVSRASAFKADDVITLNVFNRGAAADNTIKVANNTIATNVNGAAALQYTVAEGDGIQGQNSFVITPLNGYICLSSISIFRPKDEDEFINPTLTWDDDLSAQQRIDMNNSETGMTHTVSVNAPVNEAVVYSVSPAAKADINSATGALTLTNEAQNKDVLTVTATLPAIGCYNQAVASYEIYVKNLATPTLSAAFGTLKQGYASTLTVTTNSDAVPALSSLNGFAVNGDPTVDNGVYTYNIIVSSTAEAVSVHVALEETADYLAYAIDAADANVAVSNIADLYDNTPANGTLVLEADYAGELVINKTLTINGNGHSIGNLTVENSGDLTLSGNLTVNDFSIYAKAGNSEHQAASGQVRSADKLTVNGNAYFLYTVDPSGTVHYGWYDFTVPFPVNVMSGIAGIDGSGLNENFVNERDYAIMEFLGDKKAAGQYAYKKFRGIMQPGILYSITLDDDYNYNTIRFKKTDGALAPIASVDLPGHSGEITTKENWNGVGNGSLHHINIGGVSPEVIQVYQSGDKSFLPVNPSSCSFAVGVAFMIQGTGTMTFPQASNDLLAPRRAASAPQRTAIQIAGEGKPFSDQLFISADEMAGQAYTQGVDVAKAGDLGSAKVAQLWTNAYNTPLCAHEAQLINGEAHYALSIYAPANGSYTLTSQNIPDGATLYLTQNGNMIWDLSEAYTLDLTKGTNTEYSLLLVESHKIPTGVDAINSNADTKKIMHNGILYILRNGKVFNAQGAVMK